MSAAGLDQQRLVLVRPVPDDAEKPGKFRLEKPAVKSELAALKYLAGGLGHLDVRRFGGEVQSRSLNHRLPRYGKGCRIRLRLRRFLRGNRFHPRGQREENRRADERQNRRDAHHERLGPGPEHCDFKTGIDIGRVNQGQREKPDRR